MFIGNMNKEYLKTMEAASFLCVSMSKLWKMCHKKELIYYKMGRLNLFKKEDLIEFIEKSKVLTKSELEKKAEENLFIIKQKKNGKY